MSHEEYISRQRAKVAIIASKVLDGEISMVEAAREIATLRNELELEEMDQDILTFVLISSETEVLPIGDVQRFWDKNILAEKQVEIEKAEQWARQVGTGACRNLLERFGEKTESS